VEYGLVAFNNQGMPSIMTALKSHYRRATFGQKINDLSFAFVSPLNSKYNDTAYHLTTSCLVSAAGLRLFVISTEINAPDTIKSNRQPSTLRRPYEAGDQ
jgi:hypothetical protein